MIAAFRIALFVVLWSLSAACRAEQPLASEHIDNAVILMYHHVSDDTPPSTSISPDLFAQHMAYLSKHHNVMPLKQVIEALQSGIPLPDKTVVITFDDGFENILHNGHPILKRYDFPYTVFINPDEIGTIRAQLSWDQIRMMQKEGATFANHTRDHLHMLTRLPDESESDWLTRVWRNVEQAEAKIKQETGQSLKYLAFPFGEFNQPLLKRLSQHGYVGFGQHSGPINSKSNFAALPRFPAAGVFARMNTLTTKLNSLAFSLTEDSGLPYQQSAGVLSSPLVLTTTSRDISLDRASCFFSGQAIEIEVKGTILHARLDQPLPVGRSRINCTAPSKSKSGRFYWYSQPFFVADENGHYPD